MTGEKPCRVMVTGAGSGVGQGIIKALRLSGCNLQVIAADVAPFNSGLYRADEAFIMPKVELPNSFDVIADIVRDNAIDMIMIGSEFDLEFFAEKKNEMLEASGARTIVSPAKTIEIADDKWLTAEFLRENGLPYAKSALATDVGEAVSKGVDLGYPLILKSRTGTSSRNVHIVMNEQELVKLFPMTPDPVLQQAIDIPSNELKNEYTCSVFKTSSGDILGPFHARRTVRGGTSWNIEVKHFAELDELMMSIGRCMDFEGSLNVQLMIGKNGPVPFEINARFSGTTAVRAHFGFNEPDMAVRSYYYNEKIPQPKIESGIAMRYHEEVFVDGADMNTLSDFFAKGTVHQWF